MKCYHEYLAELNEILESNNNHSLYGIGDKLFEAIQPFVAEKNYDEVAKAIKDTFDKSI